MEIFKYPQRITKNTRTKFREEMETTTTMWMRKFSKTGLVVYYKIPYSYQL